MLAEKKLRLDTDLTAVVKGDGKGKPLYTSRWDRNHRYIGIVVQEISHADEPLDIEAAQATLVEVREKGLKDANLYFCVYR